MLNGYWLPDNYFLYYNLSKNKMSGINRELKIAHWY